MQIANRPYFTPEDHLLLSNSANDLSNPAVSLLSAKLKTLHTSLHQKMRDHQWNLFPHWDHAALLSNRSAASSQPIDGLTLSYLRSRDQATMVERLTGRDNVGTHYAVEGHRHPVIELRITPEHIAVELVLSPASWWDQRNLMGKLSVPRHRDALINLLSHTSGDFRVGFWEGAHLSDASVTLRQLLRGGMVLEWLSTFGDGQDWLRLGMWYDAGSPALNGETLLPELFERMSALYQLYTFALWTSNNNFHSFYTGSLPARMQRPRSLQN